MASVLVRDLDPAVVERLKVRAEENRRSLQKELKAILETAAAQATWAGSAGRLRAGPPDARRTAVLGQHRVDP